LAHEAEEDPAMSESTTDIRIVPLPEGQDVLTHILREGARRLLAQAVDAEVAAWIDAHAHLKDQAGRQQVVRNGNLPGRTIQTGLGEIEVRQPRVHDRRPPGQREKFTPAVLPPYLRRTKSLEELIPWLYLKGISTGDFSEALQAILGPDAPNLSATTVTRLKAIWEEDHRAWSKRSLAGKHYVYVWADGVHFNVRLAEERLCTLVIIGVRSDGTKELVAVADGLRESTESWAELLRDLRRRGMQAPVLAVGDGALGLWAALRDVFPATRTQRCWVHKTANVLAALPKSVHAGTRRALAEITGAEDREHAEQAIAQFATDYGVKWPKAVAKVTDDIEALLAFYDFPAEHWVHLKTTNPVESTFATVRLRTRVTKGPGSKQAGLAMAFKLLEAAEQHWRSVNGPHLVALVRAGAVFRKGVLIARPEQDQEAAA
jgi:putative transposase